MGDEFAGFELAGRKFKILEPYGDSSRYLIHPEVREPTAELNALRAAFAGFRPSLWSLMFSGDPLPTVTILVLLVSLCALIALRLVRGH